MILAARIAHFLFIPLGSLPTLAPSGYPPVTLLFLVIILLVHTVLFGVCALADWLVDN